MGLPLVVFIAAAQNWANFSQQHAFSLFFGLKTGCMGLKSAKSGGGCAGSECSQPLT
jgi:hypothetical protein